MPEARHSYSTTPDLQFMAILSQSNWVGPTSLRSSQILEVHVTPCTWFWRGFLWSRASLGFVVLWWSYAVLSTAPVVWDICHHHVPCTGTSPGWSCSSPNCSVMYSGFISVRQEGNFSLCKRDLRHREISGTCVWLPGIWLKSGSLI